MLNTDHVDEREVPKDEVPEDDVPEEYLDKEGTTRGNSGSFLEFAKHLRSDERLLSHRLQYGHFAHELRHAHSPTCLPA
jgi:hypothetical protein